MELLEGSAAIAESAIVAGCRFFAGSPMSPFTGLLENMITRPFPLCARGMSTPNARLRM